MMHIHNKKGQGIIGEYGIVMVLVSLALVGMTLYVQRALQGRMRDANRTIYVKASSTLGIPVHPEYEPYYENSTAATTAAQTDVKTVAADGGMDKTVEVDRAVTSVSVQRPF